jgi:heavy metal efflux system protein
VAVHNGTPVLVKDVGRVVIGIAPRLGEFGFEKQDDAVEGVILLRTGEKTQDVLKRVEAKTKELNDEILPKDVKVLPFYDRSDLVTLTTQVVERNLLRGMVLVIVILIFFLYDFRAGLIVAVSIPLALLFAFICLDLQNASANLLSIGAVDFGILVDGAVVMVENIFRQIVARKGTPLNIMEIIRDAAAEVDRPLFYAVAVIVASFLPIYVLSGPSGTLFKPMADTMVFALVGSLIVTLTLLPVLCAWFMRNGVRERRNGAFEAIKSVYTRGLDFCLARPYGTTLASALLLVVSLLLVPRIGAEFMPHLDEGALWVRATMPYTISFDESAKITPRVRDILRSFPEVTTVASELARPDDGTDPTGFFNVEFYVDLKPYAQWTGAYRNKAGLIEAINKKLEEFPGINFNYTQPAEDAVDEAETGLKSALAVKVFGSNLETLQKKGKDIKEILERVRGIREVTLVQELGQPSLTIDINRAAIARYGLNVSDINGLIQTAIGGDVATQVVQEEKEFDLIVRLEQQYRDNPDEIGNILVATPAGQQIPLKEFANIRVTNGASFIYRQDNSRYIGVQFSVEGRDLAGAVGDAMQQVNAKVTMPQGYRLDWGGEYTEYTASRDQLSVILPLTLFLIFMLLFALYSNFKFPFITVLGVVLSAPVGGIVALWLTGTPFSVSSGIGFLALFGVSVQTAVVYISYVNELRRDGTSLSTAIREGAILRLRPIMMTALVAALGLLPVALATGVGTDTQRPFALVIVSGLFTRLLISVFLMPALYSLVARPGDRLEV